MAGRWDEIRMLLEERLAHNPQDDEARRELERLQQGLPLRAAESPLARKRREEQEMREELGAELSLYRQDPALPAKWEAKTLTRRRKRIAHICTTLGNRLPAALEEESSQYLRALDECLRQSRGRYRWLLRLGIIIPLVAIGITLPFLALERQAAQAEANLHSAFSLQDIDKVENALQTANSGINRLLNRELATLISQAQTWLTRCHREYKSLEPRISELETGKGSINKLPLPIRAAMERSLQQLPQGMGELKTRWQRLCEREQSQLERQRDEVARRFKAPLPPLPALNGSPADDQTSLKRQQGEIRALAKECEAACELFRLDKKLLSPMHERLATLRQLLSDIAALRRTTALLPTARSYAQYRSLLEANTPRLYAPALRMMEIREHLPDEDKLRDQMQDHGRQLPPGMLEAARHALLEGGPSFTPAFHANAKQVQLMEDVFTATALQKVLYEVQSPGQPIFITEQRPAPGDEGVTFTPSPLTPSYSSFTTPESVTWRDPSNVFLRTIDATALLKEAGITRETFFARSNLPQLLESLLHLPPECAPALARAYVFDRVLGVLHAHEWPTMLGIAYAPTLRADARSFAKLVRECGISLEAGCWLQPTPEACQAEEAFTQWFHERRYHHYAREIARNFGALVQVHPRYIGFIDETGTPRLYTERPEGTLLWYMAESGLTTSPVGEQAESPIIFSPIFIVERD